MTWAEGVRGSFSPLQRQQIMSEERGMASLSAAWPPGVLLPGLIM